MVLLNGYCHPDSGRPYPNSGRPYPDSGRPYPETNHAYPNLGLYPERADPVILPIFSTDASISTVRKEFNRAQWYS